LAYTVGQIVDIGGGDTMRITKVVDTGDFQLIDREVKFSGQGDNYIPQTGTVIYFPALDRFIGFGGRLVGSSFRDALSTTKPSELINPAREKLRQQIETGGEGEMTQEQRAKYDNIHAPLTLDEISKLPSVNDIIAKQLRVNDPRSKVEILKEILSKPSSAEATAKVSSSTGQTLGAKLEQTTQKTQYTDLVGDPNTRTISNQVTGKQYSTPEELAKDLGIDSTLIQWDRINMTTSGAQQPPAGQPTTTPPPGQSGATPPPTQTPLARQPQLVSFTEGPAQFKIYDISGGQLRHVTAEEFKSRGLNQDQVQKISPNSVSLERSENDPRVFSNINGTRVHIQSVEAFTDAGFDWNKVNIITGQQRQEEMKSGNLIRFTTGNQVYDISTGELSPISAEDFARLGLSWDDVKNMDPMLMGLSKDPNTQNVFVKINGKDIKVRDMQQFDQAGLSRTIFLGEDAKPDSISDMTNELRWRTNLGKVWDSRSDLQELYERPDNYQAGKAKDSRAEGTSMETWAMLHGWQESADLLEAWKPENAVRVTYSQIFGEDPFGSETLEQAALQWTQSVRVGDVTSIDSLRGRINLDNGKTYNDLSESEKNAVSLDWIISPEEVVEKGFPSFKDFFNEQATREKVTKQTELFYDTEMQNFLEEKGITERRTIEDWARLTISEDLTDEEVKQLGSGEVTVQDLQSKLKKQGRDILGETGELEQRDLTNVQEQFRNALFQSTQGLAQRGLAFSSMRMEEEKKLRENFARGSDQIQKDFERQKEDAERQKQRTLEETALKQKQLQAVQAVEKPTKIEEAFTQQRESERALYETLKEETLEKEKTKAGLF